MKLKFPQIHAVLCCCAVLLAITASAYGQAGQLDSTFGHHGITEKQTVVTQTTNSYSIGAVALQNDGKIVVAAGVPGSNDFTVPAVVRFLSNGSLDKTFGANGVALLPNSFGGFGAIAIQSDGKILVITNAQSSANGQLVRYTTAGKVDSAFGTQGAVTFKLTSLSGLTLQPDGRILVGIHSLVGGKSQVARLLADGTLDTGFGTNGFAFPPGGDGALQVLSDGDILVFGGLISSLTSNGAIDTEFGVSGQLLAFNAGQALAANGDILTAGTLVNDPAVPNSGLAAFAYQSVGIGDPSFGKNGGASTPFTNFPSITAAGMSLESTGSIVELGTVSNKTQSAFGLVRYTSQGKLDTSFGSGGTVTTTFPNGIIPNASAITIQTDDKIVAAGTSTSFGQHGEITTALVVARYLGK